MDKCIYVGLAGNPNVGKSVIFNHLTGLNQVIGNWPGKTVERAEGLFKHGDWNIKIVDLPGIYSLSSYTQEEIVTREFIAFEKPDIIVNVVDASNLERNLFLTIQLMELRMPMILVVNQIDYARSNGMDINTNLLQSLTGLPVIPAIATKGVGTGEIVEKIVELYTASSSGISMNSKNRLFPGCLDYGPEVNKAVSEVSNILKKYESPLLKDYGPLWISLKLIEKDSEVTDRVLKENAGSEIISCVNNEVSVLESAFSQSSFTIVSSARYKIAETLIKNTLKLLEKRKSYADSIDKIALDSVWGYISLIVLMMGVFFAIFKSGEYLSSYLDGLFQNLKPLIHNLNMSAFWEDIVWNGAIQGIISVVTIVLPYILPFYILLSVAENSGYLARIAFLTDSLMHKIGLHGKAIIPIMMGYGCNVPAVLGTKILGSDKEVTVASFLATLVPCSARTVIILGTIGVFMGPQYAVLIYIFDILVIYLASLAANKVIPGKSYDLIMELPGYRMPALKPTLKQIWFRIKDFIYVAMPVVIGGSLLLELLKSFDLLKYFTVITDPVIVKWLGLPSLVGIVLVFGILRKELTLIMLLEMYNTTVIANILTPKQMIVFGVVTLLYIPCVSTIVALGRTIGRKKSALVIVADTIMAVLIGGIINLII